MLCVREKYARGYYKNRLLLTMAIVFFCLIVLGWNGQASAAQVDTIPVLAQQATGPTEADLNPHTQVGHDAHAGHGSSHGGGGALDLESFLLYASRVLYYAGLLIMAGLSIWLLHRSASPLVQERRQQALGLAGKFILIATIAYVFFSMQELTMGEPLSEWLRILQHTTVGRLYVAELLLGLAAPLLRYFGPVTGLIWSALFFLAEAWSGHASVYSVTAIGIDFVHLVAAAVWAGGLLLLLSVWLKSREEAVEFGVYFSRMALISFLVLIVSGIWTTLVFIPSLDYLLYTTWGKWLIAKVALTILIAITALLIRWRLGRKKLLPGALLQADLGLLGAILVIVGVFTVFSPLPPNAMLNYHQMGEEMHLTLRISPNAPGDNTFLVKVWLPETLNEGKPEKVELWLTPPAGKLDGSRISVPLERYEDEELDGFPGFSKTTFEANGAYMPLAGEWTAQIVVVDAAGTERVTETSYRIY